MLILLQVGKKITEPLKAPLKNINSQSVIYKYSYLNPYKSLQPILLHAQKSLTIK
jgi:hypothetical protein